MIECKCGNKVPHQLLRIGQQNVVKCEKCRALLWVDIEVKEVRK